MAGFDNDVMFANNVDFRGVEPIVGQVTTNGQLLIGSTVAPNIRVGNLTSTGGTITITNGAGTINLEAGATTPTTFVEDIGAAVPVANVLNVLGRSGSKTSGAANTITINSPPFADQGGSTTVTLNSGSFATAAITLTTPASAGLLDGDLLQFVATNGVLVIQFAATQVGHIGTLASSAAGTFTSTATGDSVSLRYQVSTNDWWATQVIGTWLVA